MWDNWVLDVTLGYQDGLWCFCPIEGDIDSDDWSVVVGMSFLSDRPPKDGRLVGIVHADGPEAIKAFCEEYAEELQQLRNSLREE